MAFPQTIESIAVVGTGKVATTFLRIFKNAGFHINGIAGRNMQKGNILAEEFGTCFYTDFHDLNADLILVAVADNAILSIAESFPKNQWLAHTSGSIELSEKLRENGAVFYPLQTFTEGRNLTASNIPILLETEQLELKSALEAICKRMGLTFQFYTSEERKKVHLSAIFLNNFVNHMVCKAEELAIENKIDFTLFEPLLAETFQKLTEMKAHDAQTGPARRNDTKVMQAHRQMLEGLNLEIYELLSKSIQNTYKND